MHPTIYYTKLMLKRFLEDRPVVLFVDLHGHSRKKNVFVYGCDARAEIRGCGPGPSRGRLAERVFPRLLWRASDTFAFSDCSFKVQRSKESSARVVVWRECQVRLPRTRMSQAGGQGCRQNRAVSRAYCIGSMLHMLMQCLYL